MQVSVVVTLLLKLFVADASEANQLTEGSRCERDGVEGTCISIYKCQSVILDIRDKKPPPTCGFQGNNPLVCCTDCIEDRVANISYAVIDKAAGLLWKRDKKFWDVCVDYIHTLPYECKLHVTSDVKKKWFAEEKCYHIVLLPRAPAGGEDTKRGEKPFMVLLGYGPNVDSAQWLCGGSLISDRFILTAGHCVAATSLGPVRFAALGVWKRDEPKELWQQHIIQKIIPHPEYRPPHKYNDIALLKTEKRVEFTPTLLPACLHSGEYNPYRSGEAYGWGYLGPNKPLANILQKVTLTEFTEKECALRYRVHRHLRHGYNHTTQMCFWG
ncbi:granzyme B(G,H) [Manduca sexta]|uniref:Uncharacterized protein n=1 Tax=Manduca sexta TaxID=7130 RepID=A0A922CX04_MANSE|nr:granzyme B(G,H) [Manduca sexta]KAG6461524.1 hypothetical protein O3G_MSEX012676 [Manduca sexta]